MINFESTETPDVFNLILQNGAKTDGIYRCSLSGCNNPACNCKAISFTISPDHASNNKELLGEKPFKFSLDVFNKSIYEDEKVKTEESAKEFAELLINEFDEEHWKLLRKLFLDHKQNITSNLDIESVDAVFPFEEIERDSTMVGYYEILPYDTEIRISVNDKEFMLDDQYCVYPGCHCTDVCLTFIPVEASLQTDSRCLDGIFINYKTREWKREKYNVKDTPDIEDLRKGVEGRYSEIYRIFKKRHSTMRILYNKFRGKKIPESVTDTPRIGRNDPCPCGSGKKYKKCCLNKN